MNLSAGSQYTCNFPNLHQESTLLPLRGIAGTAQFKMRAKDIDIYLISTSWQVKMFGCELFISGKSICLSDTNSGNLPEINRLTKQCCHTTVIQQAIKHPSLVVATALAPPMRKYTIANRMEIKKEIFLL